MISNRLNIKVRKAAFLLSLRMTLSLAFRSTRTRLQYTANKTLPRVKLGDVHQEPATAIRR